MTTIIFTRNHSHEYECVVGNDKYLFTKMAKVQNWDIQKFNPESVSEYDYLITLTLLRECKNFITNLYRGIK